jgi:hypothetical protein
MFNVVTDVEDGIPFASFCVYLAQPILDEKTLIRHIIKQIPRSSKNLVRGGLPDPNIQ